MSKRFCLVGVWCALLAAAPGTWACSPTEACIYRYARYATNSLMPNFTHSTYQDGETIYDWVYNDYSWALAEAYGYWWRTASNGVYQHTAVHQRAFAEHDGADWWEPNFVYAFINLWGGRAWSWGGGDDIDIDAYFSRNLLCAAYDSDIYFPICDGLRARVFMRGGSCADMWGRAQARGNFGVFSRLDMNGSNGLNWAALSASVVGRTNPTSANTYGSPIFRQEIATLNGLWATSNNLGGRIEARLVQPWQATSYTTKCDIFSSGLCNTYYARTYTPVRYPLFFP